MKLFTCTNCGEILYFENNWCQHCSRLVGFVEENNQLFALTCDENGVFTKGSGKNAVTYYYCANHQFNVCNWLVPANGNTTFCKACELNRTIPNLQNDEYREDWTTLEVAKHRLVYSLLRQHLPFMSKQQDAEHGLCFDFVADTGNEEVFTGHADGIITINVKEANDVKREAARKNMNEPYRTVLGHFRHEIGHYYWDRLIANTNYLQRFRQLFGDEQMNYQQALNNHYNNGAPANWPDNYISAYATMHPWEDWAETWAHYLHILDTLETAYSFGVQVKPPVAKSKLFTAQISTGPYTEKNFEKIIQQWLPLTFAMNSLNRSMGVSDIYPFVITPTVKNKMSFIHEVCYGLRSK